MAIVCDLDVFNLLSVGKKSESVYSGSVLWIQRTSSVGTVELMPRLENDRYSLLFPLADVVR